ncbi:uncharacterized protein [Amphiura filiformis]|uniref:uncharacterized protein isoform X2 n=1 Tax=Amphiura filiformis TaxID=82378 RepID=UPI003B220721
MNFLSLICIVGFAGSAIAQIAQSTSTAAACQAPLGLEDGRILDNQLTASTVWPSDGNYKPSNARLNRQTQYPSGGSWIAQYNDADQWIQVDLGVLTRVTGVLTQGRPSNLNERFSGGASCCPQWVENFKVQYSNDGTNWPFVQSANNQTFVGNTDQNTVVTNLFSTPVEARFIRILPTAWHEHISFRFEVVGCQVCTLPKVLCSDDSACYDPSTQSCDGSNDCTDGSDEATCGQLRQMVAFMAVKTETQTGAGGDVVTFQTNIGNAFDTATSTFTSPVSGFYLFNFRISIKPEEYPVISLMKNGIVVISTYESPEIESNYHISSNSALVQLVAGDEVKLQFQSPSGTIDHSTYGNSDKYEYSSFSGVMLY